MARGVVMPHGIVLTAHGIAAVARGTAAVRGIEAALGVAMRRGIVLTAHGIAAVAHGTGAALGVVMRRGIVLTARGTALTARGTTVADVAVASAHSTGRHPLFMPGFVAWWGRIGVAFATTVCFGIFISCLPKVTPILGHPWQTKFRGKLNFVVNLLSLGRDQKFTQTVVKVKPW